MLRPIAALIMVFIVAGQALAGGIACGIDALNESLSNQDETSCSMKSDGDCEDMACCLQGKTPTGAAAAKVCCEVFCGESTGGAQFDFTPQTLAFAPPIVSYRIIEFESPSSESAFSVFFRSAENDLLSHHSPDLFLKNSTFLI